MKPLLIYDGDCNFCRRWAARWKIFTGEAVDYLPYQEAAERFPGISPAQFQAAVQLIEPGGSVSSGAEAVFRTLAYHPQKAWMFWLYRQLPFFRAASEGFYKFVAGRRVLFSKITEFFWGNHLEPSTYFLTRRIFLIWLGVIYLIAFASLAAQIDGLIGSRGILPVKEYFEAVYRKAGLSGIRFFPSLVWIHPGDGFLRFLCWAGMGFSFLLILELIPVFALFFLWLFYLSLAAAGQDFLSFQWDNLLLETGLLAIFFAPFKWTAGNPGVRPSGVIHGLFKWLLFRLMFSSGFVKLAGGDPAWRNLTALSFHYETQPLPVWTSWFMRQLPAGFHKISAGAMFGMEILIPFLIFAPRRLRFTGCFFLILFQILILATGNYCFFNLLTIGLCLLLLDDSVWKSFGRFFGFRAVLSGRKMEEVKTGGRPHGITLAVAALIYFISGAVFFQTLNPGLRFPKFIENCVDLARPFRSINRYGLFAVMTTSRPEIILEASLDGKNWEPYEFKYKPGDPFRKPVFVQPHQPRLDWQMWFAALGTYPQNPWFISFCVRLLEGEPKVLRLLRTHPFPARTPKYIRAVVYDYRFTDPAARRSSRAWWKRERKGLYLPALSLAVSP